MKYIWITWENQRRNGSLSKALSIPLFNLSTHKRGIARYLVSSIKTLKILKSENPGILIVQNPSIILATVALLARNVFSYKLVVDAHNAGLFPKEGRSKLMSLWANQLIKRNNLTVVTNESLLNRVESMGGQGFVLPDPLPEIHAEKSAMQNKNALFICSWAEDEPYLEVIEAAKLISDETIVYITGKWEKKKSCIPNPLPHNVVLTGFVPNDEFERLLVNASVVIDLTTREDCLVCGAYEALAAEKPQILSETKALRSYFSSGAVFTRNKASNIAEAIEHTLENEQELISEATKHKQTVQTNWNITKSDFLKTLKRISAT